MKSHPFDQDHTYIHTWMQHRSGTDWERGSKDFLKGGRGGGVDQRRGWDYLKTMDNFCNIFTLCSFFRGVLQGMIKCFFLFSLYAGNGFELLKLILITSLILGFYPIVFKLFFLFYVG